MFRPVILIALSCAAPLLQGCLAKAAFDVATAPVKMASKAVDVATTSQSEADENRGRQLRKREERLGQLERDHAKQSSRCIQGDREACTRRDAIEQEISQLLPTVPARYPD
jgi:hypothetical protein